MLVTCFGYTGYKNAKFGRIEVHEAINGRSRNILMQTKDIAESMGFTVLHGIVDCLWVQGHRIETLRERADRETGLFTDLEHFDWLVFLPQNNGNGAYNRYYGRLSDGSVKIRGIAARRHDTPGYISTMQCGMLDVMAGARMIAELRAGHNEVKALFRAATQQLPDADPQELLISRRISQPHLYPPLHRGGGRRSVPHEGGAGRTGYEDPVYSAGRPKIRSGYGMGGRDV